MLTPQMFKTTHHVINNNNKLSLHLEHDISRNNSKWLILMVQPAKMEVFHDITMSFKVLSLEGARPGPYCVDVCMLDILYCSLSKLPATPSAPTVWFKLGFMWRSSYRRCWMYLWNCCWNMESKSNPLMEALTPPSSPLHTGLRLHILYGKSTRIIKLK